MRTIIRGAVFPLASAWLLGRFFQMPIVAELASEQRAPVLVIGLIAWFIASMVVGIRSTKDLMWCEWCSCSRCRTVKRRQG